LESQFDENPKLKQTLTEVDVSSLRSVPTGRDKNGLNYWFFMVSVGQVNCFGVHCSVKSEISRTRTTPSGFSMSSHATRMQKAGLWRPSGFFFQAFIPPLIKHADLILSNSSDRDLKEFKDLYNKLLADECMEKFKCKLSYALLLGFVLMLGISTTSSCES
jgi:hypothetical protein